MRFAGVNFLLILLAAGLMNLIAAEGWQRFHSVSLAMPSLAAGLGVSDSRWLQMAWLFLKTGLFSFGGAYASMAFLQQGAVEQHHWLTSSQLLDGVALSVATPGPFMLFTTFTGFVAGGLSGAVIATFFVFLPSFVFVLGGARYIEAVRNNQALQSFLAGVSAGVVGVIIVVSIELLPAALIDVWTVVIALSAFLAIVLIKVDIALVAVSTMGLGVLYALGRAFF
jgi:chromate transporter